MSVKKRAVAPAPAATRAEQKDETRRRLLDAGAKTFAERGYAATNVADIARAAGVAHGTVYVHFSGKDALADELLAGFNAALAAQLGRVLADAGAQPLEDVVRRAARAFVRALHDEAALLRWGADRLAPTLGLEALREGVNAPARVALEAALAGLLASRGARGAGVQPAALGLLALWFRLGLVAAFGERAARAEAEDVLVRMTVGAVGALLPGADAKPPRARARSKGGSDD